ncbi:MAG: hypothetical protein IJF56_08980, partial [Clostridia bacterium]|nr:hypothetical protein [Clostridia bacterium]
FPETLDVCPKGRSAAQKIRQTSTAMDTTNGKRIQYCNYMWRFVRILFEFCRSFGEGVEGCRNTANESV